MKTILAVFALCLAGAIAKDHTGPLSMLSSDQRAMLRTHKEECIKESGVEQAAIDNFKAGMVDENDEKFACFGACMLKKIGILEMDGTINQDVARAKIPLIAPGQVDEILKACDSIRGDNFCMTGGKMLKCLMDNHLFAILQ